MDAFGSFLKSFLGRASVLLILFLTEHSFSQNLISINSQEYPPAATQNFTQSTQHPSQPLENVFPGVHWDIATPAWAGLDEEKLNQFISNVGGSGCIIRFGFQVKTWGDPTSKDDWASCSKTVTSLMLLFAVHESKLNSVDDLVEPVVQSLFSQELIEKDKTMTFRHLANMVSGYALPEDPGTAWGYNDYAISLYNLTLFDGVFQETPNDVITAPNRLGPLQFEDGSVFGSRNGYGLKTSPRDFARIGWFMLNKGNWNGVQILPEQYFDNYMMPGVPGNLPNTAGGTNDYLNINFYGGGTNQTPYGPGVYGFNWWYNSMVGTSGNLMWPDAPIDAYQANGHWNKETMTVFPEDKMVVAVLGNLGEWEPGSSESSANQNLKLLKEAILSDSPLPVQLSLFNAEQSGNSIVLRWTTASELNVYGFFIERIMGDPNTSNVPVWEEIGFVPARGNSTFGENYVYVDPDVPPGAYTYRLRIQDLDGSVEYSREVNVDVDRAIQRFALDQNYPNPFNPSTNIHFQIPNQEYVVLKIFNILGEEVRTLANKVFKEGEHTLIWDGKDNLGDNSPAGVYLYSVSTHDSRIQKKMLLIR